MYRRFSRRTHNSLPVCPRKRGLCSKANISILSEKIGPKLGIKRIEDWYTVTNSQVVDAGGAQLLNAYKGSLQSMLADAFPFHEWLPWKFAHVERNWWSDNKNQRKFMDWLRKEMGYTDMESLYSLRAATLVAAGGSQLLKIYNKSPSKLVESVYPEHEWKPWKFSVAPRGWWSCHSNQLAFMQNVQQVYNLPKLEDLYSLTKAQLLREGGLGLMNVYGHSVASCVMGVFPEHEWEPWKFVDRPPLGWWKDIENQKKYIQWLGKQLGYKTMEDWYSIRMEDFDANNGAALRAIYNHSPSTILQHVFPDHKFLPWKFGSTQKNWWRSRENRTQFLDWLKEHLNFVEMDDLYRLTIADISNHGGYGLVAMFKGSTYEIIKDAYPKHRWLPWKFHQTPKQWWASRKNQLQYIEWLRETLGYTDLEDLYLLTASDIIKHDGRMLLRQNCPLPKLIQLLYPKHQWDLRRFRFQSQTFTINAVKSLLPKSSIETNVNLTEVRET